MMRAALLLLLALSLPAAAETPELETVVRYVSAEHVYLDAGSESGVQVGDRARVLRDDRVVAGLEVIHTCLLYTSPSPRDPE